jgi:hypothetical protein
MPIQYTIRSNKMVGKEEEYAAMVRPAYTADIDDVVDSMTQQGCALSKAAVLGVLEMFVSTIERLVLEGVNVTTPLVNVHASVTGTFKGSSDHFDRRRHRIVPRVTPGRRLRRTVRLYARAQKVIGQGHPIPAPIAYYDLESGTQDGALTPGGLGRVIGLRLKFDPTDPLQGIFFVSPDRSATRVAYVAENRPRQLLFLVPPLPAGSYTLEVRARGEDSPDVRTGQVRATLTVPAAAGLEMPLAWSGRPASAAVEELS